MVPTNTNDVPTTRRVRHHITLRAEIWRSGLRDLAQNLPGNQNTNRPVQELPLPVQLTIAADARYRVPPETKVALQIDETDLG